MNASMLLSDVFCPVVVMAAEVVVVAFCMDLVVSVLGILLDLDPEVVEVLGEAVFEALALLDHNFLYRTSALRGIDMPVTEVLVLVASMSMLMVLTLTKIHSPASVSSLYASPMMNDLHALRIPDSHESILRDMGVKCLGQILVEQVFFFVVIVVAECVCRGRLCRI
jgi:hypothetical protein